MYFNRDDVARQFDSATFARGAAYLREGRVLDIHINLTHIEGEVAGSGRGAYRQSVRLVEQGDRVTFVGECTCPMKHNCKHVVALLLSRLDATYWAGAEDDDDDEDDDHDDGGGLELDAALWLRQLEPCSPPCKRRQRRRRRTPHSS